MPPLTRLVLTHPVHFLAFGFGAGLSPFAPGTLGTLVAIPLYLLLSVLCAEWYWLVTVLLALFGVWVCGHSSKLLGVHDHPGIVWDEIVGFLVAVGAAPRGALWIAGGFVLFRIFDIVKPWPANVVDRQLGGGAGIMLDDMVAGIYTLLILGALTRMLR